MWVPVKRAQDRDVRAGSLFIQEAGGRQQGGGGQRRRKSPSRGPASGARSCRGVRGNSAAGVSLEDKRPDIYHLPSPPFKANGPARPGCTCSPDEASPSLLPQIRRHWRWGGCPSCHSCRQRWARGGTQGPVPCLPPIPTRL